MRNKNPRWYKRVNNITTYFKKENASKLQNNSKYFKDNSKWKEKLDELANVYFKDKSRQEMKQKLILRSGHGNWNTTVEEGTVNVELLFDVYFGHYICTNINYVCSHLVKDFFAENPPSNHQSERHRILTTKSSK